MDHEDALYLTAIGFIGCGAALISIPVGLMATGGSLLFCLIIARMFAIPKGPNK